MAATSAKSKPKPQPQPKPVTKITGYDVEADARRQMLELITPFGWEIDPDVKQLPEDVIAWLMNPEDHVPANFMRCVYISSKCYLPGLNNANDAKAAAFVCLQVASDFVVARTLPDGAGRILIDRSEKGRETPFGTVFSDTLNGFAVWFGRKAGKLPGLEGDAGKAAMRQLFGHNVADSLRRVEREVSPSVEPAPATAPKSSKKKMVAKKEAAEPLKDAETRTVRGANNDSRLQMVPLRLIQPAKENHRKTFDKEQLTELADSIKAHGVLQPLLLRPLQDGSNFMVIIAGERRYRAALQAGLKEVPAQIVEREGVSESLAMLHENIMRVDLNPIERAQAIRRLMDEHSLSQKEVGQMIGCGQGQISNELRLLNLPESLQAMVAAGQIAPTLIRVVLPYADCARIMDEVVQQLQKRLKDKETREDLTVGSLEVILDDSIDKNTRRMRDESKEPVSEWSKLSKLVRYFGKVDPQQLKVLDVRKVKYRWGHEEERCFNVVFFDELNREPLKARVEKFNELKKKQDSKKGKADKPDKSQKPYLCSDYPVKSAIIRSLTPMLADVLEKSKDKAKVRAVCLTLMACADCISEPLVGGYYGDVETVTKLLTFFAAADSEKQLRDKLVAELRRDFHLDPEEILALGTALGADLLQLWKPTDELVQLLTDNGRELLAAAAGSVPEFLLPFFGVEKQPKRTSA